MQDLKAVRKELDKEKNDLYNRLHSIAIDAEYVSSLIDAIDLPCIPNPRCGTWYIDPTQNAGFPIYFKSTDGHAGQWSFNWRRSNLQLLPEIVKHDGVIIVDSTRKGKVSQTANSIRYILLKGDPFEFFSVSIFTNVKDLAAIPIWCAVINQAASKLFPDTFRDNDSQLRLPSISVASSEFQQIQSLLPRFTSDLLGSAYPLEELLAILQKPLYPLFTSPSSSISDITAQLSVVKTEYYPVVCVSASMCALDDFLHRPRFYVPGSGDDEEAWSQGLSPQTYWESKKVILAASRAELDGLIASLVASHMSIDRSTQCFKLFDCFSISFQAVATINWGICFSQSLHSTKEVLCHPLRGGKLGHGNLFKVMPSLQQHLANLMSSHGEAQIAFTPEVDVKSAKDAIIATLLIYACSPERTPPGIVGRYLTEPEKLVSKILRTDKSAIRMELQKILTAIHGTFQPSRTILNRVNDYLMAARHKSLPQTP